MSKLLIVVGNLEIDQDRRICSKLGVPVNLSPKELDLLLFLLKRAHNGVFSEALLRRIRSTDSDTTFDITRKYVQRLRSKLQALEELDCLKTHHGSGFSFEFPTD